jgi:hypothetical protein
VRDGYLVVLDDVPVVGPSVIAHDARWLSEQPCGFTDRLPGAKVAEDTQIDELGKDRRSRKWHPLVVQPQQDLIGPGSQRRDWRSGTVAGGDGEDGDRY